ncbi:hypothetical protein BC628DRAFT_220260 [Trametes gibbosa]|nr:hypothetical protein BC628DRAFT_220260 [Trametes gibbosa]
MDDALYRPFNCGPSASERPRAALRHETALRVAAVCMAAPRCDARSADEPRARLILGLSGCISASLRSPWGGGEGRNCSCGRTQRGARRRALNGPCRVAGLSRAATRGRRGMHGAGFAMGCTMSHREGRGGGRGMAPSEPGSKRMEGDVCAVEEGRQCVPAVARSGARNDRARQGAYASAAAAERCYCHRLQAAGWRGARCVCAPRT